MPRLFRAGKGLGAPRDRRRARKLGWLGRIITRFDLQEVSLVPFPMNSDAVGLSVGGQAKIENTEGEV